MHVSKYCTGLGKGVQAIELAFYQATTHWLSVEMILRYSSAGKEYENITVKRIL